MLVGSCADPAIGKLVGWRTVAVQVAGARVEVTTAALSLSLQNEETSLVTKCQVYSLC